MVRLIQALSSAAFSVCATAAFAQPAADPAADKSVLMVGTPQASVLRAGTPIALKMREELTTKGKDLRVGQRFQLEVAEPVLVNGQVVITAGSPAIGEVTAVRNKGMWGKSGGINARALFVRANGQQIRLSGQVDDKGKTGTAGVVGAVAFVPLAGFLVTGTSATIPLGAPVNAFIDEDVPLMFAQPAAQTPMMVAPQGSASPASVQAPQPKN
jgi:hypothetical protein